MELWIRSQDKEQLCKANFFRLCCDNEIAYGHTYFGFSDHAIFATKERALEVLNEIQDKIKNNILNEDIFFSIILLEICLLIICYLVLGY